LARKELQNEVLEYSEKKKEKRREITCYRQKAG